MELDTLVGLVGSEVDIVVVVVVVGLDVGVFDKAELGPGPEVVVGVTFELLDEELLVAGEVAVVEVVFVLMADVELVYLGVVTGEVVVGLVSFISRPSISTPSMKICSLQTCTPSILSVRSSYAIVISLPLGAVWDLVVDRVSSALEGRQTETIFPDTSPGMIMP